MIERELDRICPFLATTKVLVAAVRAGVGREDSPRGEKWTPPWRSPGDSREGTNARPVQRLALDFATRALDAKLDTLLAEPLTFTGGARR